MLILVGLSACPDSLIKGIQPLLWLQSLAAATAPAAATAVYASAATTTSITETTAPTSTTIKASVATTLAISPTVLIVFPRSSSLFLPDTFVIPRDIRTCFPENVD